MQRRAEVQALGCYTFCSNFGDLCAGLFRILDTASGAQAASGEKAGAASPGAAAAGAGAGAGAEPAKRFTDEGEDRAAAARA